MKSGAAVTVRWAPAFASRPWRKTCSRSSTRTCGRSVANGWDVGARQQIWGDSLYFDATYYRNDFRDLIVFDFTRLSMENVGRARSSGVSSASNHC